MATTSRDETINILRVEQGKVMVHLLGSSPLINNRLSEKAKRELLFPAGRKTQAERSSTLKHDPLAEFRASPYTRPTGPTLISLPVGTFKGAMGTAALDLPGPTKAKIGRLVWVEGRDVHIYGKPQLFMAIVRNSDMNHTPDIRSRAILPEWACSFTISYVIPMIKEKDVLNLLVASGITAGVGDWRPEKGKGAHGRYEVVDRDHPDYLRLAAYGREVQESAMLNPECYDEETEELFSWYNETVIERGFDRQKTIQYPNGVHEVKVGQEEGELVLV